MPLLSDDRSRPRQRTGLAAAAAGVLVLSTAVLGWVLPLSRGRLERPSAGLIGDLPLWAWLSARFSPLLEDPQVAALLLLAATGVAFAAAAVILFVTWREKSRALWVVVVAGGLVPPLLNVGALPNLNTNIYNYILRGRVAAVHGANPYRVAAKEFPEDAIAPYANPRNTQYPGGKLPGWMIWNVTLARVTGDDPVTNLLAYRTMLFVFSLMNLGLVAYLARRLIPDHALAGFALWAWNPIVILEGQSRTDTVMVFYLLFGMSLLVQGHRLRSVLPFVLSVLVKLLTLPLLAVGVLAELRAGRRRDVLIGLALAGTVGLAVGYPFFVQAFEGVLKHYADTTVTTANAVAGPDWTRMALRGGFALLILAVGLTRDGSPGSLFRGWAVVQLYFSLFFAKFGSADYHMTLLALVAVTMNPRLVVAALGISFGSLLFDQWYRIGSESFRLPDLFPFEARVVLLIPLGIAALLLGTTALRSSRAKRERAPAISRLPRLVGVGAPSARTVGWPRGGS